MPPSDSSAGAPAPASPTGTTLRRGATTAHRYLLREVRAVGNVWGRATAAAPPALVAPSGEAHRQPGTTPWPAFPPTGYLGQLEDGFQHRLRAARSGIRLEDCSFYHTSVLTDGTVLPGPWDLRGNEGTYLGHVNVAGERVLEFGPATGSLTWYMEDTGADVVTFDLGYDVCGDILPSPDLDPEDQRAEYLADAIIPVQNSWWYLHRDRSSSVRAVYGNIYALPGDLGTFDTSVFASILLHLRDPFLALQQAAARTTRRLVVTDILQDPSLDESQNLSRFGSAGFTNLSIWWTFTPEAIRNMLRFLGFDRQTTTTSRHTHHIAHDTSQAPVEMETFTIVGERSAR